MTGTWTLVRHGLRRDRLRIAIWAVAASLMFPYGILALDAIYPTAADRQVRADLVSTPAATIMTGPGYGMEDYTLGAMTANEFTPFVVVAICIMSILLAVRHTRAEEETGRTELVRAGVVGRSAQGVSAFVVVTVANLAVATLSTVLILASGAGIDGSAITVVDTLALTSGMALTGMAFGAVALVTAQVTEHARTASGLAMAALGAAFVVRAAGDIQETHGSTLSWFSPLAWAQQMRPFVDLRWWPLALTLALVVVLLAVASTLSARRDLGAGLVAPRSGRATARPGLRSPFALAWRLQRASVVAWGAGIGLLALLSGTFASSMDDMLEMVEGNEAAAAIFGDADQILDGFNSVMILYLGLMVTAFAISSISRARAEEQSGRAEPLFAGPVARTRWLGAQLAVTAVGTVLVLVVAAVGLAAGELVAGVGNDVALDVAVGTLAYLPAVAVVVGAVLALYGLVGRDLGVGWLLLVYGFVAGLFGPLFELPEWAMRLSPFYSVPDVADTDPTAGPLIILTAVAAALILAAFVGFRRRDLTTG
ncbi:ABC transporter permease [Paraoerskovia marina]|uniref:ABC transporter permease n=1 Tax=Paraoerskovia marina TaxID=545619 RepID=UPI00049226A7|nr:hypothetical protein [Paraoerskovia marina]